MHEFTQTFNIFFCERFSVSFNPLYQEILLFPKLLFYFCLLISIFSLKIEIVLRNVLKIFSIHFVCLIFYD